MAYYPLARFLTLARFYVPVITAVAALVIGIVVTSVKVKQTKILGLSVVFSALSGIISAFYNLFVLYKGSAEIARYAKVQSILLLVFPLVSSFFVCFYIHRNYHKKYFYIPVLLIPVAGRILYRVTAMLIDRLGTGYSGGLAPMYRISMAQNIYNLITGSAVTIILIVVFYLNKNREKIIPHTYIIYIISAVWTFIFQGYNILYYMALSVESMGGLSDFTIYKSAYVTIILTVFAALVSFIFPVYLLVRVIKALRAPKEEQGISSSGEPS